jgi:predicted ATPase
VLRLGLGSNNIVPESVAHVIGDKKLLLVLDNCEPLIEAAANLAETLLTLCPNITILVTSREILRIQGGYCRWHQIGIGQRPQFDKPAAIGELAADPAGNL